MSGYNIVSGIKAPVGSAGMTQLQTSSADDSFTFNGSGITTPRTMQFSIPFYGTSRNQPFFNSNTYITFGSGSTQYNGLSLGPAASPALPTLSFGRADNSWQRCYESSTASSYRFRYEGNGSTSGTPGSPGIVYEITFFKQNNAGDDVVIEFLFGVHNRTTGQFGMTNGLSSGATFTNFPSLTAGTGLIGTSGALSANRSYVLVLTSTGSFKNLYSGYYVSAGPSTPTLTTTAATSITTTTASSGGSISSDGGASVSARGVCWSTTTAPTIALTTKTSDGTGTGTFTSAITGLATGTLYYVRAYATNSVGTAYGNEITFTTDTTPTVTTTTASAITGTTASSGGNVTADGGDTVSARGICWDTSPSPTTALPTKTSDGTGTGAFTSSITGLSAGTTYYVRAYATNGVGTAYGSEISFTTDTTPTVSTTAISAITGFTASSGGNVSADGGDTVSARGVCWDTSPSPTIALATKTSDGTGTGVFTSAITGLSAGTTYYVRSYATNTVGTAYGSEVSFTTDVIPTVSATTTVSAITATTASSGGTVAADGGETVSARGVCWDTSTGPTIALATKTSDGTGTGTFTSSLTGLNHATLYYVRAYATNSVGTAYGPELTFTTLAVLPTVSATAAATSITDNTATSGGTVSADGGATVSARGVCWDTSANPTVALATKTSDGTGVGSFTSALSGLTTGTLYYVRAYATNSIGTAYGPQQTFTTLALPTISGTTAVTSITDTTATSGGTVSADGGSTVSARGVCWDTVTGPTIALPTKTSDGTGIGSFTSALTGLSAGITYYVRAYATNSVGTVYGSEVSFTTYVIPEVSSFYYRGYLTNMRFLNGYAAYSGASFTLPTSNLAAISTTTALYLAQTDAMKYRDSGPAARSTLERSLIWSSGTPFTAAPAITSDAVVQTGTAEATLTTTISDIPVGQTVNVRGAVWGVSPAPTIALSTKTVDGLGEGSFTSALTGLTARQYYYVRAYATLSGGATAYGPETLFEVAAVPTLTTATPASVSTTTAVGGGQITAIGGAYAVARGLVWSDSPAPTTALSTQSAEVGFFSTSPAYTTILSSLLQGVQYYIRAFATNRAGTAYGSEQTFTTLTIPTVATAAVSAITATTASSGGTISADGGADVLARGVVWGTTTGPTIALPTKTTDGNGVGAFVSAITGLTTGTTYYVRAYATNSIGTAYGGETSFTTIALATISTISATAIASNSSAVSYVLTATGGESANRIGVVWDFNSTPTVALSTQSSIVGSFGIGTYSTMIAPLYTTSSYWLRSFAVNTAGTAYGSQIALTASAPTLPKLANLVVDLNGTTYVGGGSTWTNQITGTAWTMGNTSYNATYGGVSFNGSSSFAYASSVANFSGSTFTIICYYYKNSTATDGTVLNVNRTPSNYLNEIVFRENLYLDYRTVDYGITSMNTTTPVNSTGLKMVSVVRSGTTSAFYLNATANGTATGNTINATNVDFYIGKDYRDNIAFLSGVVKRFLIYNTALTASEIAQVYSVLST